MTPKGPDCSFPHASLFHMHVVCVLLRTEPIPWPMTIGVMIAAPVVYVTETLQPSFKVEHAIEIVANLCNLLGLS